MSCLSFLKQSRTNSFWIYIIRVGILLVTWMALHDELELLVVVAI